MKHALRSALLVAITLPAVAAHATIIFNLSLTINGSTPTGSPPYAIATLMTVTPGVVSMTLANTMEETNFIDNWVFNINPCVPVSARWISGPEGEVTFGDNFTNGGSNMKAGLFDLMFHYPTANSDPNRFRGGTVAVYELEGAGLTESCFSAVSVRDGQNSGGYYTAAHVQGFDNGEGSGSIGTRVPVPEPATLTILALALLPCLRRRTR